MISPEELNAIKARLENVPAGPWTTREDGDYYQGGLYIGNYEQGEHFSTRQDVLRVEDGDCTEFLRHSRTDVPKLVEEVRRLHKALEEVKCDLADIANMKPSEVAQDLPRKKARRVYQRLAEGYE